MNGLQSASGYLNVSRNWKRPYIVERSRPNKVILTMPMESLLDENVKAGLVRLFGEQIEHLPQPQLTALAIAYSEEEITNERLQYALDIHRADITKMLSDMCSRHLLGTVGHGRGTRYHVYGANVALPKKYSKEQMQERIREICADWITVDEIAAKLGRDIKYVKNPGINLSP